MERGSRDWKRIGGRGRGVASRQQLAQHQVSSMVNVRLPDTFQAVNGKACIATVFARPLLRLKWPAWSFVEDAPKEGLLQNRPAPGHWVRWR